VLRSTWARPDAYLRAMTDSWRWLPEAAPSERAMLEAFFLWIYTPRAHANGVVGEIIEETLAFPHPQSTEAFQAQLAAFMTHDTLDRLGEISVPTLVLAGELDIASPPRFGRVVADGIPNARFKVLAGELTLGLARQRSAMTALAAKLGPRRTGSALGGRVWPIFRPRAAQLAK
jgi:pimeloyl-ACP methyl ester carboxylesterase